MTPAPAVAKETKYGTDYPSFRNGKEKKESNVAWVQNPAVNMWVEITAGSLFALTGFSLDTPVFPSPQKLACEYSPFVPHGRFARRNVCVTTTEIPY